MDFKLRVSKHALHKPNYRVSLMLRSRKLTVKLLHFVSHGFLGIVKVLHNTCHNGILSLLIRPVLRRSSSAGCRTASFLQALGVESKVTSNVITDLISDINKESLHSVLTLQATMEVKSKERGGGAWDQQDYRLCLPYCSKSEVLRL